MVTDEEIAAMSVAERRALVERLSRPAARVEPTRRWLQRTRRLRLGLMAACAALLVPWIVYLGLTLPHHYDAHHWDATWVGFDVILLVLLAATAVLGYLRRMLAMLTAFATGVVMLCDAWFDVLTSNSSDRPLSLLDAVVVEVPLAIFLITVAFQLTRVLSARLTVLEREHHIWEIPLNLPDDQPDARPVEPA